MIKIEIDQTKRQEIDRLHEAYIKKTAAPRLEDTIAQGTEVCEFLKKFFGDTKEVRTSKIILICLSDKLKEVKEEFCRTFADHYGFEFTAAATPKQKETSQVITTTLNEVLNYKGFNAGCNLENGEKWNRHKFITSLGVKVCPYCNREYITPYEYDASDERTTADADHYYPKAIYPILQMNIYNMIPSCNVCNSKTKMDSDKRHLYPYKDPSNSLMFQIPLDTADDDVKSSVTEIKIDTRGNQSAQASNIVFKLDKIYQAHLDIATEIKRDVIEYINAVGTEIPDLNCEDYYMKTKDINILWDEPIYKAWFRFMGKDLLTEPLLKLKQDIFNQMMKTQYE